MMRDKLVIGTRKSPLALWQSNWVGAKLREAYPNLQVELHHIVTQGDRTQDSKASIPSIGGKGLFTAELEESLAEGTIDLAVHSLKDLPTSLPEGFVVAAVPVRAPVNDIFISREGKHFAELPSGSVIGTSSVRRVSQILRLRSDLKCLLIRGNVDSRLRKLRAESGEYDAIILAHAGVSRLGLADEITEVLSTEAMLPAPGQGAMGVECRATDTELIAMLAHVADDAATAETDAERSFLHRLGAGCNTPVAALASFTAGTGGGKIQFRGRCLAPDGSRALEVRGSADAREARALGESMAEEALAKGFRDLIR